MFTCQFMELVDLDRGSMYLRSKYSVNEVQTKVKNPDLVRCHGRQLKISPKTVAVHMLQHSC
jgi:hypothetical protein